MTAAAPAGEALVIGGLRLRGGRIVDVAAGPDPAGVPAGTDELTLMPGWIDLQVNGGFGIDLTSTPAGLWDLAARLPATGVTAFLPTLVSPDAATVSTALAVWQAGPPDGWAGAVPLGWHLEGPFIAPDQRGTHPRAALRAVDLAALGGWAASGAVRMVTLAPELDDAEAAIRLLDDAGIVVAMGHSGADHARALRAIELGVRAVTHVFNAMPSMHHREPGLVGVALTDDRLSLGVIADGLHVHDTVLRMLHVTAGAARIHLVTDAMAAAGLGEGRHRLGDLEVVVGSDGPRNADGGLAGSAATYDQVVAVWQDATACAPAALAQVTSGTAASLMGDPTRGHLRPGARADITGVDSSGRVALTVVGGRVLHDARTTSPDRSST